MQHVLGIHLFPGMMVLFTSCLSHPFYVRRKKTKKTVALLEPGLGSSFHKPGEHSGYVAALFLIQDVFVVCLFEVNLNLICFDLFHVAFVTKL